jgi:outer membrane protein TolC
MLSGGFMFPCFLALANERSVFLSIVGSRLRSIAAAVALASLSQAAFGAHGQLSLVEAQRLAVARSHQLTAQDAAASASQDMAVAARQLPDPVLKLGIDNLPVTSSYRFSLTDDFMTMRRVGVSQEFTRSDKRRYRAERFEREADKAAAQKEQLTAQIERETALAWLDRHYTEAMVTVIAEQRAQTALAIEAAEGTYRGGRGAQADVLAARGALALIDDRASEFDRRLRNAKVRLERWVGERADAPLFGEPDIDNVRFDLVSLDALSLGAHLAHHPEIAVLNRQEQIAQAEAKLAQANEKADWTVEVNYGHRGSAYSDMISVGVSVPLQWDRKNRQDRELGAKLAAVDQARDERDEMLRQHVADTRELINEWQSDRARHERYEHELIPLADERTEASLAAYRGGKAGISDVLAARRDEIDVRLQALQLEAETARLWAQLNFLYSSTTKAMLPATTGHQ